MPLLTVIIPVYNVAPYLRKTLDSVVTAVENLANSPLLLPTTSKTENSSLQLQLPTTPKKEASTLQLPLSTSTKKNTTVHLHLEPSPTPSTFQSLVEVICVDDGSTDDSGSILDAYAEKVKVLGEGEQRNISFVVRHQKNAGVSSARNAALDLATGEWVMMLDSDDTWAPDLLVQLFSEIAAYPDCDAVGFGLEFVNEKGERTGELGRTDATPAVMTGDELLLNGRGPYSKFIWSSCDKIYRRTVIEKILLRYAVGMKHAEDSLFSQVFFAYAGKVVLRPDIMGYKYLMRAGSAIHVQQTKLPEQPFRVFEVLYAHWQKLKTPGLRLRLYYTAVGMPSLGKGADFAPSVRPQAIKLLLASKTFNSQVIPFSFRNGGLKARVFATMYLISPRFVRRKLLEALG